MAGLASNPEVCLKSLLLAVCLINMPAVRAGSDSTGGLKHSPKTTWQNQGRQVTASHVEVGEQDAMQRQEESPPQPGPCTFATPHTSLGKTSHCTHRVGEAQGPLRWRGLCPQTQQQQAAEKVDQPCYV